MAKYCPIALLLLCHVFMIDQSEGGTRMLEPPTRATLWRYGYGTPTNNWDDKTDCGGYDNRYMFNSGNCGVCGDPSNEPQPRRHEAGGAIAPNPRPVRAYQKGSFVTVVMETTSSLFGKFEFRICEITDSMTTPEQSCFDANRLSILEAELGIEYKIGSRQGIHTLNVQLPESLVCTHCILQWRHITGFMSNQHSCFSCPGGVTRCHVCQGCGNQVWYVGCTDIAIYNAFQTSPDLMTTQKPPDNLPANSSDTTTTPEADMTTTVSTIGVTSAAAQCACPNPDPRDNQINSSFPYSQDLSNNSNSMDNNSSNRSIDSNRNYTDVDNKTTDVSDNNSSLDSTMYSTSPPTSAPSTFDFITTTETSGVTLKDKTVIQNNDGTIISPSAADESHGSGSDTESITTTTAAFDISTTTVSSSSSILITVTTSTPSTTIPLTTTTTTTKAPTTTRRLTTTKTTTTTSAQKPTTFKQVAITTKRPIASISPLPPSHPTTTKAPTSVNTNENSRSSDETCYVTNRRRHPRTNMDHWCRHNCPAIGVSVCVYQTCMPVLCTSPKPVNNFDSNNVSKPGYLDHVFNAAFNQHTNKAQNPTHSSRNLVDVFNPYSHIHNYNTQNNQNSFGYSPYASQIENPHYKSLNTDLNHFNGVSNSQSQLRPYVNEHFYVNPFLSRNLEYNRQFWSYNQNNRKIETLNSYPGTVQPNGNSQRFYARETNVFNPYSKSPQQLAVNYDTNYQHGSHQSINLQPHQSQQQQQQPYQVQQQQQRRQQQLRQILQTHQQPQTLSKQGRNSNYVTNGHIRDRHRYPTYSNSRPQNNNNNVNQQGIDNRYIRTNNRNNNRNNNRRNNNNWMHLLPFLIDEELLAK